MTNDAPEPIAPGAGRYVPAIDGLRAVAILAVIAFHLRPGYLPGGLAGVDLFFVVSGFVVTSSLARRRFSRLGELLAYFYARRIIRILPALLVMLLVVTLLSTLVLNRAGLRESSKAGISAFLGLSNLVLALTGGNYFAPHADLNPFLHTWTLGVEEQFYLLFPLFFYHFRRGFTDPGENRRAFRAAVIVSLLSFVLCGALRPFGARFSFYLMPARLWELGAGVALCLAMHRWSPVLARMGGRRAALACMAALAALALAFLRTPTRFFPFPEAVVPVAAGMALIALVSARPASVLARALSHPAPVFIGRISYSLYLWHWPVFVLFGWTVGLDGARNALAALALSTAAALGSYYLVEQPPRLSAGVKRMRRRAVLASGAGSMLLCALAAISLYAASPGLGHTTATAAFWSGPPLDAECAVRTTGGKFAGGRYDSWTPACAPRAIRGVLYVVGDSHAEAFGRLIDRYAAETGTPVVRYYHPDCDFIGLFPSAAPRRPSCLGFSRAVHDELARRLTPDDVLFMPGLRMPRFADIWGVVRRRTFTRAEREAGYQEALAALRRFSATGAALVLVAPIPLFRSPPDRCLAWFNRDNPVCRPGFEVSRGELLAIRAPTVHAMNRLASTVPRLTVWDPFPILCPGDPCSALRGGLPLYLDRNHLSGRGNDVVYPDFLRMTMRVAGTSEKPR